VPQVREGKGTKVANGPGGRPPRPAGTVLRAGQLDEDRFDRSRRVEWLDMDSIENEKVLVVGAGALGNEVVKDLVLSGFRRITLVDMDRVVMSNLNRCLFFTEADSRARRTKAAVVARRAAALGNKVKIDARVKRIEDLPEGFIRGHGIVLGCLDNLAARLHLNAHTYPFNIPYIDGGTLGTTGKVQVVLPPETPCLECGMNRTHMRIVEKRFSCTGEDFTFFDPKLAAEITTTSVIAAILVREALKISSGHPQLALRNMFYYDARRNVSDVLEVDRNPDCPIHPAPREEGP